MVTHSIIQGDDYDYDYSLSTYKQLDGNWGGTWAIILKSEFGTDYITPLATGALSVSADNKRLQLRIPPADTNNIPLGAIYMLIVEITNNAIGFNREIIQDSLIIKPQGILV